MGILFDPQKEYVSYPSNTEGNPFEATVVAAAVVVAAVATPWDLVPLVESRSSTF